MKPPRYRPHVIIEGKVVCEAVIENPFKVWPEEEIRTERGLVEALQGMCKDCLAKILEKSHGDGIWYGSIPREEAERLGLIREE